MFDVAREYPDSEVPAATAVAPAPRPGRARRPPGTVPPAVELRHLRALLTVATALTIGRAAERLGITQPALSRQLRELEHATGITLLERSARGVALTPAGVSLTEDSKALLAAADRLLRETTRARRGSEGRCVIGAVATAASSELLARVTEGCGARHPEIQIVVQEMATPAQREALARADIDLGLAHAFPTTGEGHTPAGSIVATRVQEDRLETALLAASHPFSGRRSIDARELADLPFLFMERGFHPGFYDRLHAEFARLGLRPRVDATYDGLQAVWAIAAQGKGWAVGFRSQLARPPLGTAAVRIRGFSLPFGLDLLSRRGESSHAVRAVARLFREARATARARTTRRRTK
jgi:DNA-binding transcriptional LysR family regulator